MDDSQLDVEAALGVVPGSPRKPSLVSETRRDIGSAPFASLDLNNSALPPNQDASSSPPPSSPPSLAFGLSSPPSSVAFGSSPVKAAAIATLSSPIKPAPIASRTSSNAHLQVPTAKVQAAQSNGDEYAGLRELEDGAGDASVVKYALQGSFTHALLVGRSRAPGVSPTPLPPSAAGLGAKPTQLVALPNHAKHVSRLHAIVEYLPFPASVTQDDASNTTNNNDDALTRGTFVVRILGQNGLIVEGKRRAEGQVLRLKPGYVIDFFGVAARFDVSPLAARPKLAAALPKPAVARPIAPAPRSPTKSVAAPRKSRLSMSSSMHDSPIPSPFASSSSPDPSQPSNTAAMDVDSTPMHEPSSPTLSRRAAQSKRVRPAQLDSASESEEEEEEEAVLPRHKKKQARFAVPSQTSEAAASGSESDLTPTPTPSPPGSPVLKAAAAAPVVAALKTRASRAMPPPSAPASRLSSPAGVSSLADAEAKALVARAREAVARLAPSYDLEGLLAGAIVFHRTATISATEAVRSVLASTPGLMLGQAGVHAPVGGGEATKNGEVISGWAKGDDWTRVVRKVWRETLEGVLHGSECFGVIQRAGKDASGAPLENWHYYDKEKDPDPERAANLGVFAKPLRAALKTHKPIFWKKSAYGHAASPTAMPYLGSESQVGSASPLSEVIPLASSSLSSSSSAAAAASKTEKRKAGSSTSARASAIWAETQLDLERETTYDRHGDEDYRGN